MKLMQIAPPPYFNIFAGLVFCSMLLAAGRGFGETYNDGQVHNVSTAMTSAVTVTNATTLNWTYNGASYPLQGITLTVNGGSTFYYNQNKEVLGNTSATFSGTGTVATLDYYTANSNGITINDGAVLNIYNKANNGYGALLGNGSGGIKVTSGSGTLNLYGANASTWGYASLRNNGYPINVGTNATLTVNGTLYNTYNADNQSKNLTKKGAGTLIVQHGKIGATHSGNATTYAASTFIVEAGKVQLANGASIYEGATIQLASGTTMDIESTASASNSVTFTGVVTTSEDKKTTTIAGGSVNVKGKLLKTGVTVQNGVTLTLSAANALSGVALTLNKASLVVGTVTDTLYQQYKTSNVTDSTITASAYTTLDGKYVLNGTNKIESTVDGHANYGGFLFNGDGIKGEVINVQTGTTTITTTATSKGIRMRSQYSGFNVASGANLVVNSNITYDPSNTTGTTATEIYKTGAGTMNLARGTIGGFASGNAQVTGAGTVNVKQGTLEISGTGMIYSGSTVNVAEGATLNFTSTTASEHVSNATYNVSGTMRIACPSFTTTAGGNTRYSNVRGTVIATGSNALVDLAVTGDPIGWAGTSSLAITLKDGATLTNSITRTSSNDGSCQVTVPGAIVLEGGKITSQSIGRQSGSYGNYLICNSITVQGNQTSTIDAYMFQIRNGSLTIKPGSTLEICSKVSSNGTSWNIGGGGTFRPITQTRTIQTDGTTSQAYTQNFQFLTNHSLNFKNVTLDLTSLDTPITTTGKEWKLLSTSATNSLGTLSSAGKITTTADTKVQVELTVEDGKLLGQTLQATGFDINGSALELFLDEDVAWDQNVSLLNGYTLFDKALGNFASIAVNGNLGELHLSLNADGNGFVAGLPEPATWVLMLVGVGGFLLAEGRRPRRPRTSRPL